MAAAEKELHREMFVDDRIARLETHAEHFQEDLKRVEAKVDKLDVKIDKLDDKLEAKIDKLDDKLEAKIDKLDDKLGTKVGVLEVKIEKLDEKITQFQLDLMKKLSEIATGRMSERVWLLLIGAALLGVMARGFKWI
jgi:phage shock protein A